MARTVTTLHKTLANGRPVILAKSGGKQLTTPVDLSKSEDWNHGTAAGALLFEKWNFGPLDVNLPMTHTAVSTPDKTTHTFTIGQ